MTLVLLAMAVATIPLIAVAVNCAPPLRTVAIQEGSSTFSSTEIAFKKTSVGLIPPETRPRIAHVQVIDFDEDGQMDVLACDALASAVYWYRAEPGGGWEERRIDGDLPFAVPAHATVVDVDQDGDRDVLVAVLGDIFPTDEAVGGVIWLENKGDYQFTTRVLLDDVRRVADVQAGDLDGDGDLDLAVAVFGYDHGEILWLENRGGGNYRDHQLMAAPGVIHVPIADYDGDGDLDLAAIVTQDEEEVWGFENTGGGVFQLRRHLLYATINFDLGGAGLFRTDLDQDGDEDLLLAAGDNLEIGYHYPQPYHGCLWLENEGGWQFTPRRIAEVGGVYAAAPGDLDGDGDLDVVLASMFNDWARPGAAGLVWLENDGEQHFRTWQIDDSPTHLCTIAVGDVSGDGKLDIVTGGLHIKEPYDRMGRVTAWISKIDAGSE